MIDQHLVLRRELLDPDGGADGDRDGNDDRRRQYPERTDDRRAQACLLRKPRWVAGEEVPAKAAPSFGDRVVAEIDQDDDANERRGKQHVPGHARDSLPPGDRTRRLKGWRRAGAHGVLVSGHQSYSSRKRLTIALAATFSRNVMTKSIEPTANSDW